MIKAFKTFEIYATIPDKLINNVSDCVLQFKNLLEASFHHKLRDIIPKKFLQFSAAALQGFVVNYEPLLRN